MKSYLDLVPISAKVHRKQNRMSIICIVLAVFLVTAIFEENKNILCMEKM